jgi:glycosyltransferase involved in cell wall biosynthesis
MHSICFVNDFFLKDENVVITGPMVQIYLIGKELAKRGWEVNHVVTTKNNKANNIEEHEGMIVHFLFYHRYGELLGLYKFLNKLKEINSEIYYQRGRAPMAGMIAYFTRKNGKKFIWSSAGEGGMARSKYTKEQLKKKTWVKKIILYPYFWLQDRVYEYGIEKSDIVFAQTHFQLVELRKEFGRDGIVFGSGHPIPDTEVLEKPKPPILLWIGAIKKSKQPELFLELARRLDSENAFIFMIGRLIDERYQDNIMLQTKTQNNFEYIGEIPFERMPEWFSKASLVVNTTIAGYEGLPNVFIQSWLHGVPIVSLHSDPDDVIKKHEMGYQTGDFDLMVKKVRDLIRDYQLREQMSRNARNFAIHEFSIESITDHFVEVCKTLN